MGITQPDVPIELFCQGTHLDASLTLDEIVRTVWEDDGNDLILHYRVG